MTFKSQGQVEKYEAIGGLALSRSDLMVFPFSTIGIHLGAFFERLNHSRHVQQGFSRIITTPQRRLNFVPSGFLSSINTVSSSNLIGGLFDTESAWISRETIEATEARRCPYVLYVRIVVDDRRKTAKVSSWSLQIRRDCERISVPSRRT